MGARTSRRKTGRSSQDIQKDIQRHPKTCLGLITVLSALSLPLCIERRFLRPSQRIDNILRALQKVRMVSGLTLWRQGIRVQNTKLLAQRAGKRFYAEDTENDEVISSFKQSFVESWQALMKMKLHPRLNSQARQLLDAMDAAQQRQFLGRTWRKGVLKSGKLASASWNPSCFIKLFGRGWNLQSHETSQLTTSPQKIWNAYMIWYFVLICEKGMRGWYGRLLCSFDSLNMSCYAAIICVYIYINTHTDIHY